MCRQQLGGKQSGGPTSGAGRRLRHNAAVFRLEPWPCRTVTRPPSASPRESAPAIVSASEGPDLPSEPEGVKFADLLSSSSPAALCFRTIAGAVTGTGLELIYVLSGAATPGRQRKAVWQVVARYAGRLLPSRFTIVTVPICRPWCSGLVGPSPAKVQTGPAIGARWSQVLRSAVIQLTCCPLLRDDSRSYDGHRQAWSSSASRGVRQLLVGNQRQCGRLCKICRSTAFRLYHVITPLCCPSGIGRAGL